MGNQSKEEGKKMPEKKFRAGGVVATIWKNTGKGKDNKDVEFFTTNLERTYKDKQDEWASTSTMRLNDLPKVILVCQKAYEFLAIKEEKEDKE